jgi:prepilin-type N-terminal cleavage/methylation domain-containing protein
MKNQKGFTLIELLVVIAIIGLLSTLAVISLNNARQRSRDTKRVADIKQVQTALELYFNDNNGYPVATSSLSAYIASFPVAPLPVDGTCSIAQNSYGYASGGTSTYELTYCIGSVTGGMTPGMHTATPAGIQ